MTLTNWITITGFLITIILALYFGHRKGELKNLKLYVTPSKLKKGFIDLPFFKDLKDKIPAVGILNFLSLPSGKHKRICYHIFITIQNPTKYHIEDANLVLLYPRKLCDETDKYFFKPTGNQSKNDLDLVFVDEFTVQVTYTYASLHPKSVHQVIHPIIIPLDECLQQLDVEDELLVGTEAKGFSFYNIQYMISAKNLKTPVRSNFWLVNIIGNNEKFFFNREKKFLHFITRQFKFKKYFFEKRNIMKFKEGKTKKDVLVVETNDLNIGYSSFPPLKDPNGYFNFEKL